MILDNVNNDNTVAVHITEACNLHCPGCYATEYGVGRLLDRKKQIKALSKLNPEYITLYGGEPLCDIKGCKDIINAFSNKQFILHTNATLDIENSTEIKEIYDRMDIIFFTVESFMYNKQPKGRTLPSTEFLHLLRHLKTYADRAFIIHNIYPKDNDSEFYVKAKELNIPYAVYPIIAPTDECDISLYEFKQMRCGDEPVTKPKYRILVDGTVTRDMRGVYNNIDEMPIHNNCIVCNYRKQCPYMFMFPHFVKDYLSTNANHWFCNLVKKYVGK